MISWVSLLMAVLVLLVSLTGRTRHSGRSRQSFREKMDLMEAYAEQRRLRSRRRAPDDGKGKSVTESQMNSYTPSQQ